MLLPPTDAPVDMVACPHSRRAARATCSTCFIRSRSGAAISFKENPHPLKRGDAERIRCDCGNSVVWRHSAILAARFRRRTSIRRTRARGEEFLKRWSGHWWGSA